MKIANMGEHCTEEAITLHTQRPGFDSQCIQEIFLMMLPQDLSTARTTVESAKKLHR